MKARNANLSFFTALQIWLLPDLFPIFLADIFVDLNWDIADVKPVPPISSWSRNPIFITTGNFSVIRFESLNPKKFLIAITNA